MSPELLLRFEKLDRAEHDVDQMLDETCLDPEVKSSRGTVSYWNFLPTDELNAILTLCERRRGP